MTVSEVDPATATAVFELNMGAPNTRVQTITYRAYREREADIDIPAEPAVARAAEGAYRSESGTNGRSSGPMYSAVGRISLLSASCSMTCAAQPARRAITNTGVNNRCSMPSWWNTTAL